jgi:hypothetical protein
MHTALGDGFPPTEVTTCARSAVSRIRLLRCLTCGNTVECKPADLLRFTQTGWLRCCGDVMTLFTPAAKPGDPPTKG